MISTSTVADKINVISGIAKVLRKKDDSSSCRGVFIAVISKEIRADQRYEVLEKDSIDECYTNSLRRANQTRWIFRMSSKLSRKLAG